MSDLASSLYMRADEQYHRALRGAVFLVLLAGFAHVAVFSRALRCERELEHGQATFETLRTAQDLSAALSESLSACGTRPGP
jgi:CHASE3 domain sensor protein